ncbi:MAG: glycosyltransferase family 4 protein [Salinibacterium sp.]|nr:glycosyltransferase family 4 protein [Salinibacterium sp.]
MQRNLLRCAQALRERGHEVSVVCTHWEGRVPEGLELVVLPNRSPTNHGRNRTFAHDLQAWVAHRRPDVVVGFDKLPGLDIYYAADVCHEADVRQQKLSWLRFTPRHRLYSAYERAVFSRQSKTEILVISDRERRVHQQYFHTPQERFHLLPPGVSRDRLRPQNALEIRAEVRAEAHLAPDDILLLLVGSNFRKKGLDRALLGVASLPPEVRRRAQLFVLGKDRPNRWIRRARRLGLERQVRFLYLRSDIPRMLLGADLLLHPAHRENTGTIILEGLVAGLPVLATDVCGYAHYIADADAGRLVRSPFRQGEFDRQLLEMLTTGQLGHWSRQAVDYAKRSDLFSLTDRAAEAIEAIHVSMLREETLTT